MGFKLHIRKGLVVYFYCGAPVPEYLVMEAVLNPCLLWTWLGSTVPSPLAPLNKNKVFTQLVQWEGYCSYPSRTRDLQGMSQTHGMHTVMHSKKCYLFSGWLPPLHSPSMLQQAVFGGVRNRNPQLLSPLWEAFKIFFPCRVFLIDLYFSIKQNLSKGK